MQKIKFRAWKESAPKGSQMYSWKEIQELDMNIFFHQPEKYKLMQSTSLYDKAGKEIYIGDLVVCYKEGEDLYEVLINDFSQIPVIDCNLGQENLYKCHEKMTVVGNIHDEMLYY